MIGLLVGVFLGGAEVVVCLVGLPLAKGSGRRDDGGVPPDDGTLARQAAAKGATCKDEIRPEARVVGGGTGVQEQQGIGQQNRREGVTGSESWRLAVDCWSSMRALIGVALAPSGRQQSRGVRNLTAFSTFHRALRAYHFTCYQSIIVKRSVPSRQSL